MRLLAVVLMAALWFSTPAAADELSIATAGPLSGPQAKFGTSWQNGMALYFDEVNAAGGVRGQPVALVRYDDKADPDEAARIAEALCADAATLTVIGHFNSGAVQRTLPLYGGCGMPVVTTGSNPALTRQGFTNIFRPIASDFVQGGLSASHALDALHAKTAAVIHDGQVFGQGVADIFAEGFRKGGGELVSVVAVTPADLDFSTLIGQLKSQTPDVVYLGAVMPQLALFAKQMKAQGLAARLLVPDGGYTGDFIREAGIGAAQGTIVSFQVPPSDATPELAAFAEAYRVKLGEEPGPYSLFGYVFAQIVIEAIRNAETVDRAGITAALRAVRLDTAVGRIEFDDTGELEAAPVFLYEVVGEAFKLIARSR
ncbi:MAG: branched-chain amino acid ABC transporter substrate-binding protein [Alphaproteobacteria bacterium]